MVRHMKADYAVLREPTLPRRDDSRIVLTQADAPDRESIYRLRHEVYARELGQHALNAAASLRDALDGGNVYLVAKLEGQIAGFISITPPGGNYSVDKYVGREQLPFDFDGRLHEIRLLTVERSRRGQELAALLMYAAFRWVESHGGTDRKSTRLNSSHGYISY